MDDLLIQTVAAPLLDANMHVVRAGRHAFAVDPFPAPELLETLEQNQVTVDFVFLTHEHYDHISGAAWFKERTGCPICCSARCAENITRPEKNLSKYFDQLAAILPADKRHLATGPVAPFVLEADERLNEHEVRSWQGHALEFHAAPGHSPGGMLLLVDRRHLFSGDSLLRDYPAFTRLPGGSARQYRECTLPYLSELPPAVEVYPGHYEGFSLRKNFGFEINTTAKSRTIDTHDEI